MQQNFKNILIIGMSKMGKTHFAGQLYGRLDAREGHFELRGVPEDIEIFKNILDCLNRGVEGEHTPSAVQDTITLPMISKDEIEIDLIYPDYAGEKLRDMLTSKEVNKKWEQQIQNSNNWFLFIRMDLIETIEDITTKFYTEIIEEDNRIKKTEQIITNLAEDSSAFYIDLIQTFLYIKKLPLSSKTKPVLTILLSCWDKQYTNKEINPTKELKRKMPLFFNFLQTIWDKKNLHIIGLSSIEKDLTSTPDNEFAKKRAKRWGYFVIEDQEKQKDLTLILKNGL